MSDADSQAVAGGQPFDDLLQAVYAAVKRAQSEMQQAAEQKIAHYFPLDPQSGKPSPLMVQIPLPGPNGVPVMRDVPLFALVPHHDIMIDSVLLRMRLSLLELVQEAGQASLLTSIETRGVEPDSLAEIEIRFRGVDAAQGIARINDALIKQI